MRWWPKPLQMKRLVSGFAPSLVRVVHHYDASYIEMPMKRPNGAAVAICVRRNGDAVEVNDMGHVWMASAQVRSLPDPDEFMRSFAALHGVRVGSFRIFTVVDEPDTMQAVLSVAAASHQASWAEAALPVTKRLLEAAADALDRA